MGQGPCRRDRAKGAGDRRRGEGRAHIYQNDLQQAVHEEHREAIDVPPDEPRVGFGLARSRCGQRGLLRGRHAERHRVAPASPECKRFRPTELFHAGPRRNRGHVPSPELSVFPKATGVDRPRLHQDHRMSPAERCCDERPFLREGDYLWIEHPIRVRVRARVREEQDCLWMEHLGSPSGAQLAIGVPAPPEELPRGVESKAVPVSDPQAGGGSNRASRGRGLEASTEGRSGDAARASRTTAATCQAVIRAPPRLR